MPIPTDAETLVRQFAWWFPTPNVRAALAHCVAGRLPWEKVAEELRASLGTAVEHAGYQTDHRADAERTIAWTHQQYELANPITPAQRGAYQRAVELLDQEA